MIAKFLACFPTPTRHNLGQMASRTAAKSINGRVSNKLGQSRATDLWRVRSTGEILSSPVCYRRFKTKSRAALQRIGLDLIEKPEKVLYVYPTAVTLAAIRAALPRYRAQQ